MRAIDAAVSASMLSIVEYCSTKTSKRASSSRLESTLKRLKRPTVSFSTSHGSASGVERRFARPRFSASSCQACE